jgi:hypothetical protein
MLATSLNRAHFIVILLQKNNYEKEWNSKRPKTGASQPANTMPSISVFNDHKEPTQKSTKEAAVAQ